MNSAQRPNTLVWAGWLGGLILLVMATGLGVASAQGTAGTAAPVVTPGQDPTLPLRQRAAEYWAARVARDYRTQWSLSEPRLKGRMTPEEYAAGKGAIQYLGYEIGDAKIDGSFAVVQVKVIAKVTLPKSKAKPQDVVRTVGDAWINVEGVWYRRADQPEGSPPTAGTLQ